MSYFVLYKYHPSARAEYVCTCTDKAVAQRMARQVQAEARDPEVEDKPRARAFVRKV